MSTLNISYESVCREELKAISVTTTTYPNVTKDEKETTLPKTKDNKDEHGNYFIYVTPIPCSYEKVAKKIYNFAIFKRIHKPFLLSVHKDFERVIVDAFVYHKFSKS